MSSDRVHLVWNKMGNFFDVHPRVSKSLANMRDKILTIKGVKWEWHVVLTVNNRSLRRILARGGFSGEVLRDFLDKIGKLYKSDRKYFWKYEEGRKGERPHYHLLLSFGKRFNKAYLSRKLNRIEWERGDFDLKGIIGKQRKYWMNRDKTDEEILMGLNLHKRWGNGIVYAKEIKGMGNMHQRNLMYYVNKDVIKPTGFKYHKRGSSKWGFGQNYKFELEKKKNLYESRGMVNVKKAEQRLLNTNRKYYEYYDGIDGRDGYREFWSKYRKLLKGEYNALIK
ncbi:MAG: hypothetical protein ACFFAO_06585 [Candidatus Hermodarchaeota archaeon]